MLIIILLAIGFGIGWMCRDSKAELQMTELRLSHQKEINELLDDWPDDEPDDDDGEPIPEEEPEPEPVKAMAKMAGR